MSNPPYRRSFPPPPLIPSNEKLSLFSTPSPLASLSSSSVNSAERMVSIPIQVNNAALKSMERHVRAKEKSTCDPEMPTLDDLRGSTCLRNGCKVVCTDATMVDTDCSFHPGVLVLGQQQDTTNSKMMHLSQQQQHWSCCARKSTNLLGCATGKHRWIKRKRVDAVRYDWSCRAGLVHLSIFCPSAVPQGTRAESDGLKLNVAVAHGFGTLETVKSFDLYDKIVPSQSLMLITEKKVELILWQQRREQWTRLTAETGDGAILDDDEAGEIGVFVSDEEEK